MLFSTLTSGQFESNFHATGERFVAELSLGDIPANSLAEVMERQLGLLVLMVNAVEGVSGAACRLPD